MRQVENAAEPALGTKAWFPFRKSGSCCAHLVDEGLDLWPGSAQRRAGSFQAGSDVLLTLLEHRSSGDDGAPDYQLWSN